MVRFTVLRRRAIKHEDHVSPVSEELGCVQVICETCLQHDDQTVLMTGFCELLRRAYESSSAFVRDMRARSGAIYYV